MGTTMIEVELSCRKRQREEFLDEAQWAQMGQKSRVVRANGATGLVPRMRGAVRRFNYRMGMPDLQAKSITGIVPLFDLD